MRNLQKIRSLKQRKRLCRIGSRSHKHLEELAPSCYNIKNAIEIQNIRGEKAWLKIIMFPNSLSKDLHLL